MELTAVPRNTPFAVAAGVQTSASEEEIVILDLVRERFYGLNETAARIWHGIADGHTLDQILQFMAGEFDTEPATLQEDVLRVAGEFMQNGWIAPPPSGAGG